MPAAWELLETAVLQALEELQGTEIGALYTGYVLAGPGEAVLGRDFTLVGDGGEFDRALLGLVLHGVVEGHVDQGGLHAGSNL